MGLLIPRMWTFPTEKVPVGQPVQIGVILTDDQGGYKPQEWPDDALIESMIDENEDNLVFTTDPVGTAGPLLLEYNSLEVGVHKWRGYVKGTGIFDEGWMPSPEILTFEIVEK